MSFLRQIEGHTSQAQVGWWHVGSPWRALTMDVHLQAAAMKNKCAIELKANASILQRLSLQAVTDLEHEYEQVVALASGLPC